MKPPEAQSRIFDEAEARMAGNVELLSSSLTGDRIQQNQGQKSCITEGGGAKTVRTFEITVSVKEEARKFGNVELLSSSLTGDRI